MARDVMSNILALILGAILIVVILFSIFYFDILGRIGNVFPDFTKSNYSSKWEEEYFLEYPELIVYYIDGRDADIYLKYDKNTKYDKTAIRGEKVGIGGWSWSKDNEKWYIIGAFYYTTSGNFIGNVEGILDAKNRNFLKELIGKSPENGLKIIVDRVLHNDESNKFFNVKLEVYIGDWKEKYDAESDAKFLSDLDGLIDKFNQISRGVIKNRR